MGDVGDGIWWAWVTMTHTGFGDIVPTTVSARIFAAILIFVGVVLISLMTAHLSVFLIGSEVEKVEESVHKVGEDEKLHDVMLKDFAQRLERIEKLLEAQVHKQK
jgi:voltage-gated potassium channel